jgi:hypothetical protein
VLAVYGVICPVIVQVKMTVTALEKLTETVGVALASATLSTSPPAYQSFPLVLERIREGVKKFGRELTASCTLVNAALLAPEPAVSIRHDMCLMVSSLPAGTAEKGIAQSWLEEHDFTFSSSK